MYGALKRCPLPRSLIFDGCRVQPRISEALEYLRCHFALQIRLSGFELPTRQISQHRRYPICLLSAAMREAKFSTIDRFIRVQWGATSSNGLIYGVYSSVHGEESCLEALNYFSPSWYPKDCFWTDNRLLCVTEFIFE